MADSTSWWDIASTIATTAATAVALAVAIRETLHRRAERRDQEAAQARLVTTRTETLGFLIMNYSTAPLLNVEVVTAIFTDQAGKRWEPALNNQLNYSKPRYDVIPPQGGVTVIASHFQVEGTTTVVPSKKLLPQDKLHCVLRFTDNQGLRWERTNNGEPRRVLAP